MLVSYFIHLLHDSLLLLDKDQNLWGDLQSVRLWALPAVSGSHHSISLCLHVAPALLSILQSIRFSLTKLLWHVHFPCLRCSSLSFSLGHLHLAFFQPLTFLHWVPPWYSWLDLSTPFNSPPSSHNFSVNEFSSHKGIFAVFKKLLFPGQCLVDWIAAV